MNITSEWQEISLHILLRSISQAHYFQLVNQISSKEPAVKISSIKVSQSKKCSSQWIWKLFISVQVCNNHGEYTTFFQAICRTCRCQPHLHFCSLDVARCICGMFSPVLIDWLIDWLIECPSHLKFSIRQSQQLIPPERSRESKGSGNGKWISNFLF